MSVESVATADAPAAIGPYSQAVKSGGMVFVSGQIPMDASSGEIVGNEIKEQTKKALENLMVVLRAAGSSPEQVLKVTVYMKDLSGFQAMNEVYAGFFESSKPARAAVEVSRLPKDVMVEVDAVAIAT